MFRYGIVLFLVHPYILGLPAQPPIGSSLKILSDECDNMFLQSEIQKHIQNCNASILEHSEVEFQCLMFYDINSQLCVSYKQSKANLEENYKNVLEDVDTADLCKDVSTWKFGAIDFPKYKLFSEKITKEPQICLNVCTEDILSAHANYYCKYFKWGSDLLLSLQDQSKEVLESAQPKKVLNTTDSAKLSTNLTNANSDSVENSKIMVVKSNDSLPLGKALPPSNKGLLSPDNVILPSDTVSPSLVELAPKSTIINDTGKNGLGNIPQVSSNEISSNVNDKPLDIEAKKPGGNIANEAKQPVIESPKSDDLDDDPDINGDLDPENESDQEKGLQEDDDPMFNSDPKLNFDKQSEEKKIESIASLNEDTPQRAFYIGVCEQDTGKDVRLKTISVPAARYAAPTIVARLENIFPNMVQDTFAEDDDHFLPFFMTAIIVAILLYILYHNKNKFTKVILGLIVEGRQSSRRRNSRGHAYRRLDTLEQAMSSNTAAPPSKIIY